MVLLGKGGYIQRDSEYFEQLDNFVGKYADWYSDLSGGVVFGD